MSYKRKFCATRSMDREPDWKAEAEALAWWIATAIVAAALCRGILAAVAHL